MYRTRKGLMRVFCCAQANNHMFTLNDDIPHYIVLIQSQVARRKRLFETKSCLSLKCYFISDNLPNWNSLSLRPYGCQLLVCYWPTYQNMKSERIKTVKHWRPLVCQIYMISTRIYARVLLSNYMIFHANGPMVVRLTRSTVNREEMFPTW